MTFGTAKGPPGPVLSILMDVIVTIALFATLLGPVALIGLLWRLRTRPGKPETKALQLRGQSIRNER
jgi:hypothetical protein